MAGLAYPAARKADVVDTYHGVRLADPYRWLEANESDETKAFVAAQQDVFAQYAADPGFAALRTSIRAAQEAAYNYERVGLPSRRGPGHCFLFRNTGLLNQDVLLKCPREAVDQGSAAMLAASSTLLDLNAEDPSGTTALSSHAFSEDRSLMAYALAKAGSDWVTIKVRNVDTGADLSDEIAWAKFTRPAWLGSKGFFYSRFPAPPDVADAGTETDANAKAAVYYHRVGTSQAEDLLVYACPEQPHWRASADVTDDGRYILVTTSKGTDPVNRLYVCRVATFERWAAGRAAHPLAPGQVPPGQAAYDYLPLRHVVENFEAEWDCVASLGRRLFLKTNYKAPRGRIMALDLPADETAVWEDAHHAFGAPGAALPPDGDIDFPAAATPEQLKELLPEDAGGEVLDWAAHVNGSQLVTCVLKDVVNRVRLYALPDEAVPLASAALSPPVEVPLPGPGTVGGFSGRVEERSLFIKWVSFTSPGTAIRVDLPAPAPAGAAAPGAPAVSPFWAAQLAGFDAAQFEVKQEFVTAEDGAKIPVFLVSRKGLRGPAPTLLYAYGGFSISLQPNFSSLRLAWLQHCGGVFALACIRGGAEYGEEWHQAGMRLNKRRCFDDFACVAKWLADSGVTTPKQLCIMGGSNGGLLTLASVLRKPELYAAAVSQVPVADFLRFSLFTIGHAWRGEYGFAPENREDFFNQLSLSPYHTALAAAEAAEAAPGTAHGLDPSKTPLPAVLICTADHDDRVVPLHSFKMAAALQAAWGKSAVQREPLLLRVESKAGHGAGKPTSKILDEYSEVWAFIAKQTGATFA